MNTVEIRPRVGGVLEKQLPNEGERLKVGQLLFVIDQQPYIAALTQAQAALAQSQAALIQSQRDLGRAKSLSEIDAVSQQELDLDRRQERGQAGPRLRPPVLRCAAELTWAAPRSPDPIEGVMGGPAAPRRLGDGERHAPDDGLSDRPHVRRTRHRRTGSRRCSASSATAAIQDSKTPPTFQLFLADGSGSRRGRD